MHLKLLIGLSLSFGLLLGVVHAYVQFGPSTDIAAIGRHGEARSAEENEFPGGLTPLAVVEKDLYEFGKMEADAHAEHDFFIRNEGQAPLRLQKGDTTCKCTLSDVAKNLVPPGESEKVTLSWDAKGGPGPFRQSAVIHTNDPKRRQLTLVVSGEITQTVQLQPADLVFTSVPTNESTSAKVKVYAYHADNLQILSHRFENQELADRFEVHAESLPAEELKQQAAKSGAQITVTLKPGLPLGLVQQKIVLETNLERVPKLEIPVTGTVTSDISLAGPDWSGSLGQLRLGRLTSEFEVSRTLKLFVRGQHRQEIEFKIVRVWPEQLKAELGAKGSTGSGLVALVPLTITIPKGSPQMNHLGTDQGKMGEVVLETNHPEVKEVRVLVQFAVGG